MEPDKNPNNPGTEPETEKVNMTKEEYAKAIQSAEDKLRTKYSKDIKELEDKLAKLTPKEKTPAELEFEQRLANLEARDKDIAAKEKLLGVQSALAARKLPAELAKHLKADVDMESFGGVLDSIIEGIKAGDGFVPKKHASDPGITKEDWKNMDYSEKMKIYEENPELAESLAKR
jgi:hypothetical protein